jgi:glycosyltransferase involved in cell wall biosynthesis
MTGMSCDGVKSNGVTDNDLICISHLRWEPVYQRPQHLMSRAAKTRRVFFVEEPQFENKETVRLEIRRDDSGVLVVTPFLPTDLLEVDMHEHFSQLLEQLITYHAVKEYTLWLYTPMLLPALLTLSERLHKPRAVVYDCIDEFAQDCFASSELRERETHLFAWADVVFVGGHSLYEAKCKQHANVHLFSSSVDVDHFAKATLHPSEPADMQAIPHPRIGFVGIIDEQVDRLLLSEVAKACPDLHFIMIGPVVNSSKEVLPKGDNIHYLGQKAYLDLPNYLAHIDVAMMPFVVNDLARFISPTKTPEYLAAGKPVISTPVQDVVWPYGEKDLVFIAKNSSEFIVGLEQLLAQDQTQRRSRADVFVNRLSWNQTWLEMNRCIVKAVLPKYLSAVHPAHTYMLHHSNQTLASLPAITSARKTSTLLATAPTKLVR